MSATITFKAKPETVYNMDDTVAYECVRIPVLDRKHCDMSAFRASRKYGSYANSDLFPNILKRIRKEVFGNRETLRLDQVPENVSVDTSGFLANVTIEVD